MEGTLSAIQSHPILSAIGAGLSGLIILHQTNRWLSRRAANNAVNDHTWNWGKEVVLLTGGASGIGAEIASILAERNVKVIVVDLYPPKHALKKNQYFYKLDISSPSEIKKVGEEIRTAHGHPTVLINNAGIGNAAPILQIPEPKLRAIFNVNIISHFLLLQEFLPHMIKTNHGHVVGTASLASFSTQASNVDYACTKAGVLALHEGLLQELRHIYKATKVRCTVVHPSWVRTPLIQPLLDTGELSGAVEPKDVASAIVDQLYSGYGAQIIVPSSLWWTSGIRALPTWLQENMRDGVSKILLNLKDMTDPQKRD